VKVKVQTKCSMFDVWGSGFDKNCSKFYVLSSRLKSKSKSWARSKSTFGV